MQITDRDIESIRKLQSSRGWKILTDEIEERTKSLEDSLFSFSAQEILDGQTKYDKKYSLFDLKAYERAILKGLLEMPEELCNSRTIAIP